MNLDNEEILTAWIEIGEEKYLLRYTPDTERINDAELVEMILEDWQGVINGKGEPLPCNPKNRLRFIKTKLGMERFLSMIIKAKDLRVFMDMEATLKNLLHSPNGRLASPISTPEIVVNAGGNGEVNSFAEHAR